MDMINVIIDGKEYSVRKGATILEACKSVGIEIPTLCYLKEINEIGACRICVVEVKGARSLVAACVYPLDREGTEVFTNTPKILEYRKTTVELILSDHDYNCTSCVRNRSCELQELALELGCDSERFKGEKSDYPVDTSTSYLIRDNNKCVLCRRCVAACKEYQAVAVIGANARGFDTHIACAFETNLSDNPCVGCGQCIEVCPTGALREKDEIDDVIRDLANPDKYVIVGTAPATRIGIGEEFGYPIGSNTEGKMVAALKRLGFDKVFDTDFGADLTIMEEGTELLNRMNNNGVLPMITSCSPGWVKYCEEFFPEFLPNLSTCKSPHEMLGAIVKSYYAEKMGIDPAKIYMVSVMPCTAKKFEAAREELSNNGIQDVDAVLTVRELARMIKVAGIDFARLPDEDFDSLLGESTGAGVIFGVTGGVMEAALRTVYEVVTKKELKGVDFTAVRGIEGVKEAEIDLDGKIVRVAVAHGTANAKKLLNSIKSGEKTYDFIEVMCCPGGCVTGGGQPIVNAKDLSYIDPKVVRAKAIYGEDASKAKRKSHENEELKKLYADYLGEPNSHKAHELLHTHYIPRPKYK